MTVVVGIIEVMEMFLVACCADGEMDTYIIRWSSSGQ